MSGRPAAIVALVLGVASVPVRADERAAPGSTPATTPASPNREDQARTLRIATYASAGVAVIAFGGAIAASFVGSNSAGELGRLLNGRNYNPADRAQVSQQVGAFNTSTQ